MRRHLARAGLHATEERAAAGSFASLREYVRGDDPRHLDWKATARHGRLIVREHEAERSQPLVLCIDTGRLMAEPIGEGTRLDHGLAAAVVLAEVARAWQDHVGVLAFSDRIEAWLPPGRHAPGRIPSLLAPLAARSVEPDYPRAVAHLRRALGRRALLVVFGDVIDPAVSGELAAELARLARRHLPLFVALRNPQLFAAAAAPARDLPAAYHRAAAAELVLERSRTLAAMHDAGIRVADVAPGGAAATAIDRYLAIKRRGVL
jgi:uncharacterized protein (DUF58 family)